MRKPVSDYETCPCNILQYFMAVKTEIFGFKIVIYFVCLAQNIYCGYTLEPYQLGGSNEYPRSMF